MAVKTKNDESKIHNVVTNTNNINVNIKPPVQPRKNRSRKKKNPNWITKIIVGGLVTLILSLIGYYVKVSYFQTEKKPAVIEYGAPSISGTKVE